MGIQPLRDWDVLGVGRADIDIFLKLNRLPGRDEKIIGEYLGEYPGGVVANFCCAASRLGARTALATVVGDDRYGEMAIASLRENGVDISQVLIRSGGRTEFCVVLLDDSSEKALIGVRPDPPVGQADLNPEAFRRARVVHLMGDDFDVTTWTAREAKTRGALVSLDLEPTAVRPGLSVLRDLLSNVDLLFPKESALTILMGGTPIEGARGILRLGPRLAVVTRGAQGSVIITPTETFTIPAFSVPVVDTTGAGDCFNAAFVIGYLKGWAASDCGRFAAAAAAISVTRVGARSALPDFQQVEAFLSEQPEALSS